MRSADVVESLARDLVGRVVAADLAPRDQVRAVARLLAELGWHLAQPGLSGDRIELEAALAARGDLASALIPQGAVLEESGRKPLDLLRAGLEYARFRVQPVCAACRFWPPDDGAPPFMSRKGTSPC